MNGVTSLKSSAACDASLYGNKAANLAVAMRAGMNVPDGVAVAHDVTLSIDDIETLISDLHQPLAVRSSSLAEDSPGNAFPGVFETVLGIMGPADAIAAVNKVRDSGSGANLRAYLSEDRASVDMGVVIQELISASCAGVAFSHDPVSGSHSVIIESGYGLGKSVVDGEITPDTHEFDHRGHLTLRRVGRKRLRLDYNDGLLQSEVSAADAATFALSDVQAEEVCRLTLLAQEIFDCPIDVEWAFDHGNTLWLLQARPITTLRNKESE